MKDIDLRALKRQWMREAVAFAEAMFPDESETQRLPTQARQGFDGPNGRPLCFNREAITTYRANMGVDQFGAQATMEIPWAFSRGCKSWTADPSTDPVPLAEGWKCGGCVHYPSEAVDLALERRHDRMLKEAK